jgi:hypothetical protein
MRITVSVTLSRPPFLPMPSTQCTNERQKMTLDTLLFSLYLGAGFVSIVYFIIKKG